MYDFIQCYEPHDCYNFTTVYMVGIADTDNFFYVI